ncbi:hypothetical protein Efla_000726 [Eimeria flavescens]
MVAGPFRGKHKRKLKSDLLHLLLSPLRRAASRKQQQKQQQQQKQHQHQHKQQQQQQQHKKQQQQQQQQQQQEVVAVDVVKVFCMEKRRSCLLRRNWRPSPLSNYTSEEKYISLCFPLFGFRVLSSFFLKRELNPLDDEVEKTEKGKDGFSLRGRQGCVGCIDFVESKNSLEEVVPFSPFSQAPGLSVTACGCAEHAPPQEIPILSDPMSSALHNVSIMPESTSMGRVTGEGGSVIPNKSKKTKGTKSRLSSADFSGICSRTTSSSGSSSSGAAAAAAAAALF